MKTCDAFAGASASHVVPSPSLHPRPTKHGLKDTNAVRLVGWGKTTARELWPDATARPQGQSRLTATTQKYRRKSTSSQELPSSITVHRSNLSQDDEENQEGRSYRQVRYKVRVCSLPAHSNPDGRAPDGNSQILHLEEPSMSASCASAWRWNSSAELTACFSELQIRCILEKASQEDGDHPTRQIRLHLLRKDDRQETLGRNLELQVMPQDRRWRSIHCIVRLQTSAGSGLKKELLGQTWYLTTTQKLTIACRTPAAAAMRSTLRRLRDIAEV